MNSKILIALALVTGLQITAANASVCTIKAGQTICASTPTSLKAITGQNPTVPAPQTPAQAVSQQNNASGASCAGYWQSGRCVPNGLVAFNGGSPVNVMNKPTPVNAGGGKKQVCTLVYKYVGGRVVGNSQTVCTFQ